MASICAGAFGYLFQILIGRSLSVEDYATFSAAIAISTFLVSPVNAIVMIATRKVSIISSSGSMASVFKYYKDLLFWIIAVTLGITVITMPYAGQVSSILNFDSSAEYIFVLFVSFFSAVCMVNSSFVHGLHRFGIYSTLSIATPILKIIFGFGLVLLGLNLYGALAGVIIAALTMAIVGGAYVYNITGGYPHALPVSVEGRNLPIFVACIALTALTQLDVALVNKIFDKNDSGLYAAASIIGKSVLFLSGGFIAAIYPIVSRMSGNKQSTNEIFKVSFLGLFFLCALGVLFFKFFGLELLHLIYGNSYIGASDLLWKYSLAVMPMALVILCENYLIAKGSVIFAWIFLIAAPLEVYTIFNFTPKVVDVVYVVFTFNLSILLIGLLAMTIMFKKRLV